MLGRLRRKSQERDTISLLIQFKMFITHFIICFVVVVVNVVVMVLIVVAVHKGLVVVNKNLSSP